MIILRASEAAAQCIVIAPFCLYLFVCLFVCLCTMHPLQNPKNASDVICLVKQNDGTWIEKHQRFLFNVYKRFFFIFVTFFTFFNAFYFL